MTLDVVESGEMMIYILIATMVFAVLEWFFEHRKNKLGIYLTKPTTMLLLISWVWLYADVPVLMVGVNTSKVMWFIFGLLFCLGGDIFLMLPARFFLPGLVSFLLGHICYIIGLGVPIPPPGSRVTGLVIAVILLFVSGWVYLRLANGMRSSGKDRMRIPVLFYTIVIALMSFSALMTLFKSEWDLLASILISLGACLFLISDIMNAWVRFVTSIPHHRLWIMSTYHLAQVCIAAGVALHFSSF